MGGGTESPTRDGSCKLPENENRLTLAQTQTRHGSGEPPKEFIVLNFEFAAEREFDLNLAVAELMDDDIEIAGDALAAITEEYRVEAEGVAYRLLSCAAEAADCVQDMFMKVLWVNRDTLREKLSRKQLTAAGVKGYLFTAVKNDSIGRLRQRENRATYATDLMDEELDVTREVLSIASPKCRIKSVEIRDQIEFALQALNPRDRLIVTLVHLDGRSYKEVSAETGLTTATLGGIVSRAMKKMRAALEAEGITAPMSASA